MSATNPSPAVVFGWFIVVFILPLTSFCIVVTAVLIKEIYIEPTFNTQQIRGILKSTAVGTCICFSLNNIWVLMECIIILTRDKDITDPESHNSWIETLTIFELLCRQIGILLMFGYFLARLYFAFQYSFRAMVGLFITLVMFFVIFNITNELFWEYISIYAILMTFYSLYGIFIMYLFVRKLFEMVILRSRDLANTYYLMSDNDSVTATNANTNTMAPTTTTTTTTPAIIDTASHAGSDADITDAVMASGDVYSFTLGDKNNAKLIRAITRSCLLSSIPVISSMLYHYWQLYPFDAGKHHATTYITFFLVVADDLCAILCIFLNWNFTSRWYRMLCKYNDALTQRCCLYIVRKKLEGEQFEFMGVEYNEPLADSSVAEEP